ncbi:predicted protein [Uncinocarpus reesii 1704]|uniref:C6 finger domain transcription factor nscR n=1 Tax=Uncinocarpus reesii (strain UAMH 1704) TaxID=336963 RepID=C4JZP1_UNCRE|nr:uncharacterized protein UREG_07642 [Uncinocarpus reesii 1704]EEP82777.1 predicted protein [Uncinocarpus reesii 1704]
MSRATSPQSAGELPPPKVSPPNGRRRDKAQLSLRCDRSQPCQNCSKRGQSCIYARAPTHAKSTPSTRQYPAYLNSLIERIHHLEDVVLHLVNNQKDSTAAENADAPGEPQKVTESVGRLSIKENGTSYFGNSTWQAVLDEIGFLKEVIPESSESPFTDRPEDFDDEDGIDLLVGAKKHLDIADLYESVPSRAVADPLVHYFFENMEVSPSFWADPATASLIWLGLLFAMLSLSSSFLLLSNVDPEREKPLRLDATIYRQKAADCLLAGNYTKAGKYNLPCLILYLACERLRRGEFDHGFPVLLATIVSLALRMGYHRDARHYPELTPFAGEMRRRLWAVIVQLDLTISVGVGIPRLINDSQADNAPPRNLREEDFSEDSKELPPPRPAIEPTAVTYVIARQRLIRMLGKISDLTNSSTQPPYQTVMDYDRELVNIYKQLPTFYKLGQGPETHEPLTFLQRLSFESLYEQARCTLHRKYLTLPDPTYAYSRETCVDAALRMLSQQQLIHQESQPGRSLFSQRWKLLMYLNRENLLATMIVCQDVDHLLKNAGASGNHTTAFGSQTVPLEAKIQALEQSLYIWETYRSISKEALTAATVVNVTIHNARQASSPPEVPKETFASKMSSSVSPVQSVHGEKYTDSPMECPPVATTQYMIVDNQIDNQQQQPPQFQYRPDTVYQQPPAVLQHESSTGALEPMTTGMPPNPAYKMMETMIDAPVQFGWFFVQKKGAFWDSQFSRDYPAAGLTAQDVWNANHNRAFPSGPAGTALDPSGGSRYPG